MSYLVQPEQITQLLEIIQEEGQQDLVKRMFLSLNKDQDDLLKMLVVKRFDSSDVLPDNDLLLKIHSVKNLFSNFGGVVACRLLDKLYNDLKMHGLEPPKIQKTIDELTAIIPETMTLIRLELQPCLT